MKVTRNLAAVLPAFNEALSIGDVVSAVQKYADVIVVDDGSTDRTADIAREKGAYVVAHSINCGYDRALNSGMMWAASQGYTYAVTLDADGQHEPSSIMQFEQELIAGAEIVVGNRECTQRWSESAFSLISRALWGIHDPLCGMKGYRLATLQRAGSFDSYGSIGTELCIRASRSGCVIRQCSVHTLPRSDRSRFGGGLMANMRIVRALLLGLILARSFRSSVIMT